MSEDEKKGDTEGLLLSVLGDSLFGSPIFVQNGEVKEEGTKTTIYLV